MSDLAQIVDGGAAIHQRDEVGLEAGPAIVERGGLAARQLGAAALAARPQVEALREKRRIEVSKLDARAAPSRRRPKPHLFPRHANE